MLKMIFCYKKDIGKILKQCLEIQTEPKKLQESSIFSVQNEKSVRYLRQIYDNKNTLKMDKIDFEFEHSMAKARLN